MITKTVAYHGAGHATRCERIDTHNALVVESAAILARLKDGARVSVSECRTLRTAWEKEAFADALREVDVDLLSVLYSISDSGFLTKKELWHSRRLRNKKTLAFRGCRYSEVKTPLGFGWSWSLDRATADLFAGQRNGVVVTANVQATCWLETAERELIVYSPDVIDVLDVTDASSMSETEAVVAMARLGWPLD